MTELMIWYIGAKFKQYNHTVQENMLPYNLKMAWWNTALTPAANSAKSKATTDTYKTIFEHIKNLIVNSSCDLVALCEVGIEDVAYINSYLNEYLTDIEVLDLTRKVGRTRFDTAVIYNSAKIHLDHKYDLFKTLTGNTVKAAQLVEIIHLSDGQRVQLFLCHWASRLSGDGDKKRKASADMVYLAALELMEKNEDVILMGDFNDNPYDQSILDHLNSTRCHDAAKKYPREYFYNPFWRTVVSDKKYNHLTKDETFRSGSYKYKQIKGTMWHSYDQIMFSGSFLGSGSWHLDEQNTKVLDDVSFINDFENNKNLIDHLPVICEITKI